MELTIKSRNAKITEVQRNHIEEKLSKLARYMEGISSATVEVHTEQQRHAGEVSRLQVTLVGAHGVILRAEEQASDLLVAVDTVQEVLQRQITRYKEKYWRRERTRRQSEPALADLPASAVAAQPEARPAEPAPAQLIRTKAFMVRPMQTEDAIEQMELLGHTFFVFQDAASSQLSILYKRRDGNYGVILPETG